MAITLVAGTSANNTDSTTALSASSNTTGATLLVMILSTYANVAEPTPTDSNTNTWTPLTAQTYTGVLRVRIWYVVNPTVGPGHTFQATATGVYPTLVVGAFAGVTVTAPFDVQNGAIAAATTAIQPGSVTPAQANEIVITGLSTDNGSSAIGINLGYTIVATEPADNFNEGTSMAYLVQTAAAATNPTWAWTGSVRIASVIAAFKDAGGALPDLELQLEEPWVGMSAF